MYSGGGVLLTSTGDVVRRWKEYFEGLLNSVEDAELLDFEVDSPMTGAEVAKVLGELQGGRVG